MLNQQELRAARKLYKKLGLDVSDMETDCKYDYLMRHKGHDGNTYLWYEDILIGGMICLESGKMLTYLDNKYDRAIDALFL